MSKNKSKKAKKGRKWTNSENWLHLFKLEHENQSKQEYQDWLNK